MWGGLLRDVQNNELLRAVGKNVLEAFEKDGSGSFEGPGCC